MNICNNYTTTFVLAFLIICNAFICEIRDKHFLNRKPRDRIFARAEDNEVLKASFSDVLPWKEK